VHQPESPLERLVALDQSLSSRLAVPHEARLVRLLAHAFAHTGDSLLWLSAAAVALVWGDSAWQGFGGRVVLGTLVAGLAATILKGVFRRQRPPGESWGLYSHLDRHAFPSGHAARCACVVILLAPLLPTWGLALMVMWVGLVGLARITLRIHFTSDVLGGWAVGALAGLVVKATLR
jgi:undecaprenyl-diphosphatase